MKKVKINTLSPLTPHTILINQGPDQDLEKNRLEKDKNKHQGRVRQFPHITGNYPALFMIQIPPSELLLSISNNLIEDFLKETGISIAPIITEDLHISLSKPFPIRNHQIKMIMEMIRNDKQNIQLESSIQFILDEYEIYCNEDNTRYFISFNVSVGKSEISKVIKLIDKGLSSFGFPSFYEDPKPHLTIGWSLNNILNTTFPKKGKLVHHFIFTTDRFFLKVGKSFYPLFFFQQ